MEYPHNFYHLMSILHFILQFLTSITCDQLQFYCEMGRLKDEDDESQQISDEENDQQKIQIRKPKIDRVDKFKNFKKIIINLSMTQYPVVAEVAQHLNWKVQYNNEAGDWDVYWTDFSIDPDVLIKMHLFQKINHYPGIHVIARKNLLGISLMSLRNLFPEEYNFFPLTWMLPLQYAEFRAYFQSKQKGKARTYIAKPEAQCQGRGIFLTRKIEDLQNGKHYVVQRYLARPYLIDGLKFDLRIYVLLCGTNPLRLYMYEQGLCRLATETYTLPNTANLQRQYVHLTNYAINKNNPKFVFNNSANNMGIGHKRSLTCVFKQLAAKGIDVDKLKEKINDVAIKTVICGLPLMSHQYKCSQPQDYSGNICFHILGLDIMLDSKGEPILLEVNHTPSFTTDTPLDHKIKFNLIKDTLTIMNVNLQTKNSLYNKAKDLNKDRLLTGKRQIFEGRERQEAIQQAQKLRDEYQDKNLGGFTRIFPINDQQKMKNYNTIIQVATKTYYQQKGSIRMKIIQKEGKKLIKSDFKQMKEKTPKDITSSASPETVPATQDKISTSKDVQEKMTRSAHTELVKQNSLGKGQTDQPSDQEESQIQIQNKSQIYKQNKSEIVEYSPPATNHSNFYDKQQCSSEIKIKLYQSQQGTPTIQQGTGSKKRRDQEYTPNRKIYSKEPIVNVQEQSVNLRAASNIRDKLKGNTLTKNVNKLVNNRVNHKGLPDIIDSITATNDISSLLKKEQQLAALHRNLNPKVDSRSGKIYSHIARDIKQMIDKKTNNNGGYVMPRLLNLNFQNERRSTETPSNINSIPARKNNIFYNGNNQ